MPSNIGQPLPTHLMHGHRILVSPCFWAHVSSLTHNLSSLTCCLPRSCNCHYVNKLGIHNIFPLHNIVSNHIIPNLLRLIIIYHALQGKYLTNNGRLNSHNALANDTTWKKYIFKFTGHNLHKASSVDLFPHGKHIRYFIVHPTKTLQK